MPSSPTIAYFITPHGFGHASRSAAVMAALSEIDPGIRFEIFTTAPREIFEPELPAGFGYHPVAGDIGMVQRSPLQEDLKATCTALDHMLPFSEPWVDKLAKQVIGLNCRLVICDIAALGIVVAQRVRIASLLIENFTWDWIYEGYLDRAPELDTHIRYLADIYARADFHIQTDPLCRQIKGRHLIGPISRQAGTIPQTTRERLGIPPGRKMVLVTMGGVPGDFQFLDRLPEHLPCHIVISGSLFPTSSHKEVILLPMHSTHYHPDLMHAADAIVGKAGYSTIAEAFRMGAPFGYVKRPHSPESAVLERFIARHMPSRSISAEDYLSGAWLNQLPDLLDLPRSHPVADNGATAVARLVQKWMR